MHWTPMLSLAAAMTLGAPALFPTRAAADNRESHNAADVPLFTELEASWTRAMRAHDVPATEKLLHPEFEQIGASATPAAVKRAAWLTAFAETKYTAYNALVERVRRNGDMALTVLRGGWTFDHAGKQVQEHFVITDVWTHDVAGWRIIQRHVTPYM